MKRSNKKIKIGLKYTFLLAIGGLIYILIELLFRGRTHISMFFLGGVCFISVGLINEVFSWKTPLIIQMIIGGMIITLLEFISGCVLNLLLGLNVWDYSNMYGNVLGQICPLFSFVWVMLSGVAIVLDDWIRYLFFGEEKPHYTII